MATSIPAAVWPLNFALVRGNPLCSSPTDNTPQDSAELVQGDQLPQYLYFLRSSPAVGSSAANVQLPAGFAISLAGKIADDLGATTVLFTASGFVEQSVDNLFRYGAFLNLNTDEIRAAFAALGDDAKGSLSCLVDIHVALPAQAAAGAAPAVPASRKTYQVSLVLKRAAYTGDESAPTPATPAYPPAAAVNALVTPYQVTAAGGPAALLPVGVRSVALATALTSDLVLRAPLVSTAPRGNTIAFSDPSGYAGSHTVYLLPTLSSADLVDISGEGDDGTVLFAPGVPTGTRPTLESDGVSKWLSVPQGSSGGGSGFTQHSVADDATKLAATGVNAGDYAVITGEGNRIEQFIPTVEVIVVAGAGTSAANGIYLPALAIGSGETESYAQEANPDYRIDGYPGNWSLSATTSERMPFYTNSGASPTTGVWVAVAGTGAGPAPTVTRNDVASNANWAVIENTVLAEVVNESYNDLVLDGTSCPVGAQTYAWLHPAGVTAWAAPSIGGFNGNFALSYVSSSGGNMTTSTAPLYYNPFPIVIPCADRDQNVSLVIIGAG